DDRAGATFEVGECRGELVAGRVGGAGVVVLASLAEAGERVVGGQVERRGDGTELAVGLDRRAHPARHLVAVRSGSAHRCTSSSTSRSTAPTASVSFRNASWP